MGYTSKDIAIITEPRIISLNAAPNFVTFASKAAVKSKYEVGIQVKVPRYNLFNPAAATPNQYAGWTDGQPYQGYHPYLSMSDFIPTRPDTWYTVLNLNAIVVGDTCLALYDENKVQLPIPQQIGFINANTNTAFKTPPTARFLRMNFAVPAAEPTVLLSNYGLFLGLNPSWSAYNGLNTETTIGPKTTLVFTEPSGAVHTFKGTVDVEEVGGQVFYIAPDNADTAENIRQVLIANRWINANMEIRIPPVWSGGAVNNGTTINIESKGAGAEYNVKITAPNNTGDVAYLITPINTNSVNGDSISGEAATAEIELDIYTDAEVFLGSDDRPVTPETLGHLTTTLSKTYAGVPLWFELNSLFSQYAAFNIPPNVPGWFNTGTARTYRFIAKKRGVNNFSFYQSNALYVLNGYGYPSENLDLAEYTYVDGPIKLLTNKPRTTYVRGQKEFLNFIFSDPQRGISTPTEFSLRPVYRVFSTSDTFLGVLYGPAKTRANFDMVNTCILDIDAVLDAYPKAGIVRVALARGTALVSNDLEYEIRPECLHLLNQVVFLNRLGGWDAFNFNAGSRGESKPSLETYSKTLTPGFKKGESIETVYSSALANTTTIEGAPVTDAVAEWLKELAAARVVLDSEGNYLIKEDFTIPINDTGVNMRVPTIKYRLSETYTND